MLIAPEDRIAAIIKSEPLELDGEAYKGKYELNRESIKRFILDNLRISKKNLDTGNDISTNRVSAKELMRHYVDGEIYQKSIVHIPEIIEKMQFLIEMPPEKENAHFYKYSYYITGIKIDGKDYTILSAVGHKDKEIYYDQNIFEGNKQEVLSGIKANTEGNKYNRLHKILERIKESVPSAAKTGDAF